MPRVLYIDDDDANRRLVMRLLLVEGFEFEEANNAHDGIEKAVAHPPDLILMDISMPEMDGLSATSRIREIPDIADVKVIALTAHAMQGDRETFLESGCDGYISKPIDIDTFVDEISQYIG